MASSRYSKLIKIYHFVTVCWLGYSSDYPSKVAYASSCWIYTKVHLFAEGSKSLEINPSFEDLN